MHHSPTHPVLTLTAAVQGIFYFATGVWPLISMRAFEAVTGPKNDDWLVKTVGVLVAVTGAVVLLALWRRRFSAEVVALAVGNALVLTAIDVTYVSLGVIPPVYLLDAVAEVLLVVGWGVGLWLARRRPAA